MAYATSLQKVAEPNKKIVNGETWITDCRRDVAVRLINSNIQVRRVVSGESVLAISLANFDLICCYVTLIAVISLLSNPSIVLAQE